MGKGGVVGQKVSFQNQIGCKKVREDAAGGMTGGKGEAVMQFWVYD